MMEQDEDFEGVRKALARLTGAGAPFEIEFAEGGTPLGFKGPPHTWLDMVRRVLSMPDRPFVQVDGRILSAHQTIGRAGHISRRLADAGIGRGDRVGLMVPSGYAWVVGFFGILLAGGVAVLLPPRPPEDIFDLLSQCEAKLVLHGGDAPSAAPAGGWSYVDMDNDLGTEDCAEPLDFIPVAADDEALIAFTSGSTGTPKGALFTHRASVGALKVMTLGAALASVRKRSVAASTPVQPARAQRVLLASHLSHISGYGQVGLAMMLGHLVLLPSDGNEQALVRQAARDEATAVAGASITALRMFIAAAAAERFETLRSIGVHGTAIDEKLRNALAVALPHVQIVTGYGLAESGGGIAVGIKEDEARGPGCVGMVTPPVQIQVRGADGCEVERGRIGRLWVRSPTLMRGYVGDRASLDPDGWFDTGDIGRLDGDGLLHIVARGHRAGDEVALSAQALAGEVGRSSAFGEVVAVPAVDSAFAIHVYAVPTGSAPDVSAATTLCEAAGARLFLVTTIPRTASGKADLTALQFSHGTER